MGSSQSVPQDSPLACVKQNLKPPLLTNLKIHKLESLCTQICLDTNWITKTAGLSSGLSIFYQISQTSSNGMANGWRSPIFKLSGTLKAILSARTVLPIKSSSALSPSPLQKNLNLKPLKGPLNPQPPILISSR